ncbi:hypothetical protein [Spirosoma daeguense]
MTNHILFCFCYLIAFRGVPRVESYVANSLFLITLTGAILVSTEAT